MKLNCLTLNDKKLSSQKLFWISMFTPVVISTLLSIPLWFRTEFDFSANGYSHFLDLYKLPIGVLSLSIPLVAITAHIHRTIQTASQINITNKKNDADRFFAHQKFIIDNLNSLESKKFTLRKEEETISIETPAALYRKLFPNCSYSNGINTNGHTEFIKSLEGHLLKISQIIESHSKLSNEISQNSYHDNLILWFDFFTELDTHITLINQKLFLKSTFLHPKNNNKILFFANEFRVKIITPFDSEKEIKDYLSKLLFMVNHILEIVSYDALDDKYTDGIYNYIRNDSLELCGIFFTKGIIQDKPSMYLKAHDAFSDDEYSMYINLTNL